MKLVVALVVLVVYRLAGADENCAASNHSDEAKAWSCNMIMLNNVHQIDAGMGQVVATDSSGNAYFLSGTSWNELPSANLKHISVGPAGIWGINNQDNIFKYGHGSWLTVDGRLNQVDAGGFTFSVGATSQDGLYCLKSSSIIDANSGGYGPWTTMPGAAKYYSCGPYGCWCVNSANDVYLMKSVNAATCQNSNWELISGVKLTMVEVATDGSVFGVTTSGEVYRRAGITACRLQGTGWTKIPMCVAMKHVTYDIGHLWVVTDNGMGLVCTT